MPPSRTPDPACPLCGSATNRSAEVPGYQLPARFPIHECVGCGVSFAWPLAVADGFYDRLYDQRAGLRAYGDYTRTAAAALEQEHPLDYLAAEGPRYWGIRRALEGLPDGARLLEVGCGLGALTFALRRAGYDARGIDISERAAAEARQRFGPWFRRADVADLAREEPASLDAIVMTELIEHVPDPLELLRALVPLLRASGQILLTTPNKSAYPPGTLWQTDLPPVHLWWFSEPSLCALAERLGLDVTFVDYSEDTRGHGRSLRVKWPGEEVFMAPQLDAEGSALPADSEGNALPVDADGNALPVDALGNLLPAPTASELRRYFPGEKLGLRQLALWARYKLDPSRRVRQTARRATLTAVLARS